MKIALFNIEPKIENTALMKISQYHKNLGNKVEWYQEIFRDSYDLIYCSSLFSFTSKINVPENAICGGSGFDIKSKLPEEIEDSNLDYSIYPNCKTSYLWFSRGCIRNCSFCIVREKEGYIQPVKKLNNLNLKGEMIDILDNNFFANPEWKEAVNYILKQNKKVNLHGVDVRLINEEQSFYLNKMKHAKQIHIAWDFAEMDLIPKIKEMIKFIKPYKIMCYVLIGYNSTPEQDMMRVLKLKELGVSPFVMPFNKSDQYQRRFSRWVNHKAVFNSCSFDDYDIKLA